MSENGEPIPTSTTATTNEEEEEEVVSLMDVIASQDSIVAEADAVLGACDDKNCTYSQGYLNRQALYSCLTCIPDAKDDPTKCAGFCLACCYNCHEGHNLVELYTKRNFRCDCGNSKFPDFECKLENNKMETNPLNLYNHNFWGLYCVCKRPYPDEEDTVNDIMIQCIMCEDWYHSRHLGIEVDLQANFCEMICEECVKSHDFLLHYKSMSCCSKQEDSIVDVVSEETLDAQDESLLPSGASVEAKTQLEALTNCKMPRQKSEESTTKFFTDITWRQNLCTCVKCMKMYEDQKVLYLIDPQDPVQVYESKSLEKAEEKKLKQEEQLLKSVDRVPLMEMLAGYQELKDKLEEFLSEFKNNKRVVREQDIKDFFEEMNAKKRQRTGIQHYCR